MRARALILPFALIVVLSACTPPEAPAGALPPGIEDVRIPPADASALVYFRPTAPTALTSDAIGVGGLTIQTACVLLADDGKDNAARFTILPGSQPPEPSTGTAQRWLDWGDSTLTTGPQSSWGVDIQNEWARNDTVPISGRFSDAWKDLVLAPTNPPKTPVAAGFVRNFGPLIDDFIGRVGAGISGLSSDLALLRIESVSFVAYADNLNRIPANIGPGLLSDSGMDVLAIADSSYPSVVVGALFDRFTGNLGLTEVPVGNTNARYLRAAQDVHALIIRRGSTLYFAIGPSKDDAEDLALAVVRSQGGEDAPPAATPSPGPPATATPTSTPAPTLHVNC